MDFPIHIDTTCMGLPIVHFKGRQVEFSELWCIYVPKDCFNILANSADTDKMQLYAAFHLGLHCLPECPFRGGLSSITCFYPFPTEPGFILFLKTV